MQVQDIGRQQKPLVPVVGPWPGQTILSPLLSRCRGCPSYDTRSHQHHVHVVALLTGSTVDVRVYRVCYGLASPRLMYIGRGGGKHVQGGLGRARPPYYLCFPGVVDVHPTTPTNPCGSGECLLSLELDRHTSEPYRKCGSYKAISSTSLLWSYFCLP